MARPRFLLGLAWLAVLVFAGGASRGDDPHQIVVRLAAIFVLVAALWRPSVARLRDARPMLAFVVATAVLVALQIIPLPFALWQALPGHDFYADIAMMTATADAWRPISLAPDLTWNALLALLIPLATLVATVSMRVRDQQRLLLPLLIAILVSGALGLLQVAAGPESGLRFYRITNAQQAVGFFANRNHHAMLLAIGIVLVGLTSATLTVPSRLRGAVRWIAAATIVYLLLATLASGSRGGLVGCVAAVPLAFAVYGRLSKGASIRTRPSRFARLKPMAIVGAPVLVAVAILAIAASGDRATALRRLFATDAAGESRLAWIPALLKMATDFFPFGAGFGTFDPVYRRFERFETLSTSYANQAHNDLLQLVIEGGIFGLVLLGALLWWWATRSIVAWRRHDDDDPATRRFARAGSAITGLLLLFSIIDYPLRTPLMASLFVVGCVWMIMPQTRAQEGVAAH